MIHLTKSGENIFAATPHILPCILTDSLGSGEMECLLYNQIWKFSVVAVTPRFI